MSDFDKQLEEELKKRKKKKVEASEEDIAPVNPLLSYRGFNHRESRSEREERESANARARMQELVLAYATAEKEANENAIVRNTDKYSIGKGYTPKFESGAATAEARRIGAAILEYNNFLDKKDEIVKNAILAEKEANENAPVAPTYSSQYAPGQSLVAPVQGGAAIHLADPTYQEIRAAKYNALEEDRIAKLTAGALTYDGKKLDFFQKGALEDIDLRKQFEDGYQFGDVYKTYGNVNNAISKAVLGTTADAAVDVVKGASRFVEGIGDLGMYGRAFAYDIYGDHESADEWREVAMQNTVDDLAKPIDDYLGKYSVLGRSSDAVFEGVGQATLMVATGGAASAAGLGTAGTTALTTGLTFASGTGSGMSEAYQGGATDWEALKHGLNSGAADAVTELIFAGMGKSINAVGYSKGLSSADDMLAKAATKGIKNQVAKNIVQFGIKSGAEGLEEVLAGIAHAISKKTTYMSDEEFLDILADENLLEQFIVGTATSGVMQGGDLVNANKTGTDFITGQTQNEQAVIKKEVENRIAEAEKNGMELTKKEKSEIEAQVEKDMEKGYISTDTIESVLGNDPEYDSLVKESDEFKELYETTDNLSEKQRDRLAELKEKNKANPYETVLEEAKKKRSQRVFDLVKNDRLSESYREAERARQDFVPDYDKFKGTKHEDAARKTLENAMNFRDEDGIGLSNTNRVHDTIDFWAKTSADTGLVFDPKTDKLITNDFIEQKTAEIEKLESIPEDQRTEAQIERLAKVKDLLEQVKSGKKKVHGYNSGDTIVLNLDSEKALNRTVGHEITHSLEKAKSYEALRDSLFAYAKEKGVDIDGELEALRLMYEGDTKANPEAELVANLVGDYLFTDGDFVNRLSVENRNVFQKVYDEIKYLLKLATAGSKEYRELERVKKAFEDAYRQSANNTADGSVKYDIAALDNGNVYVTASRKVIEGTTKAEQRKDITNFFSVLLDGKQSLDIQTIEGDTLTITKKETATKARDDYKTVNGQQIPMTDDEFTVKMHVESHIDEVAEVSKPMNSAKDNKNHPFSKDGFTYRRAYFEDFDGQYYEVTLSIGHNGTVATVYNVGKIKGSVPPSAKIIAVVGSKPLGGTLSKDGISQNAEKVNRKYSLSDSEGNRISGEQQEFFKDTKTRNADGSLQVLYHGSRSEAFSEFDLYEGVWLTTDPKYADVYAGQWHSWRDDLAPVGEGRTDLNGLEPEVYSDPDYRIYKMYANIKNPANIGELDIPLSDAKVRQLAQALGMRYTELKPLADTFMEEETYMLTRSREFIELAKERGFDGFKATEKGRETWCAFASEDQVKLTTNATPTVNADIRYSLSDNNGNKLSTEQSKYFKDSKVVDENGNLKVVYHGSPKDFNTFSLEYLGTNGTAEGYGFYFTDKKQIAEGYSRGYEGQQNGEPGKLFEVYLDIKKPLSDTEVTMTRAQFKKFLTELNNYVDADGERLDVLSNYGDVEWEGLNKVLNYAMEIEYDGSDSDVNLVHSIINGTGNMEAVFDVLRKTVGYDGIIVNEASWGGDQTIYIAFHPEQIKNVDNLNPTSDPDTRRSLSEAGAQVRNPSRFDIYGKDMLVQKPEADDIAPIAENTVAEVAPEVAMPETVTEEELFPDDPAAMQEDDADAYDRLMSMDDADAPPEVANQYDSQADTAPIAKKDIADIANEAKEALGLKSAQMGDFRKLIEEYSRSENPSREQLFNDIKENFGTYKEGYFDQTISDAKKYLRSTKLYVDDTISGDIADFADFKKRNRGKVILSANGGLDVDVAYAEMSGQWPHLFPESITNPTDQLLQMVDVANKYSRTWHDIPFDDNILWEVASDIADNVSDTKQLQKEADANQFAGEALDSLVESADEYAPVVKKQPIGVPTEELAPTYDVEGKKGVPDGQQSYMPDAETPKSSTRAELHTSIVDNIKTKFAEKGYDFDEVLKSAKNLSTFATVDNTPQRVMEKALGYKEGGVLADLTVNKVAQNETEGIKWLNSFTDRKSGLLAQISKQYNIKPGSKESAAAQMYAEGFYVAENNDIIQYGDAELAKDFPNAEVQKNIKGLARDSRIRKIYDDTLAMINESRTRNAYPEIPRLDNYFLHFRAMEDTFSKLGLPFNPNDIRAKDLPTDLNGVTADLKPGQPYFASAMHRTGKRTSFDLLGGLERYLSSAKNQLYHIDDIQTLRALRNYVADTYGQANGLEGLDVLSEEEAQDRIEKVYNSHLSTFAKFLNEEANVLAGKTSLIDRGLEGIIGRRGITFLDTVNKQVGSNMVGLNVSSSLTNILPVVQTFAKTNKYDFVKAFAQTASNKISSIFGRNDGFADSSPVIIRRKGAERFYRNAWQKAGDVGYTFMSVVDDVSTELIARTKYNELTRKGMDSQQAHIETDKWVSRLMGDRSLGQQPQLYNSKMLGLFTKFQLEVRNQLDSQFYDTIQDAKVSNEDIENGLVRNAKTAAKVTSTFFQLAVAQHLFGKAFESIAGYNPAFDILSVLATAFGFDDEEESEDTALDNIEQAFLELLGDLPYTSTFTGGRIPISSALPVEQFVTGKDSYGNEKSRLETLGEIAPYYLLPGGYGQIKKTYQGLSMFSDDHPIAGSYTDSGNLRFPVEDTLGNRIQAGLFGQWASENARYYFDNDIAPLNEKQTQEFIDSGMPIQDYWKYRKGLSGLSTLAEKADYINSLDLTAEQKNILINNIAARKEDIDMSDYGEYGSFEEFDYANKNPEKYNFLKDNGVTYSEYKSFDDDAKDAYDWAFENPDKYTLSKAVTDDLVAYRKYAGDLSDIRADKDENGKTISGSAKEKKIEYINSLDLEYGQKIILFKSLYEADDTYNYEIIDYLNGRSDISFEEEVAILRELGFNVTDNGDISW